MENLLKGQKYLMNDNPQLEIGEVVSLSPFAIEINGMKYSSTDFTIYVPCADICRLLDIDFEPEDYMRIFKVGDMVSVTDRKDSLIVHNRLVIA